MRKIVFVLAILTLGMVSCDDTIPSHGGPARCEDLCKTQFDPNYLSFKNLDHYNIYVKYGNGATGDQVTFTNSAIIANGATNRLDFLNTGFNHYYFYKDPQYLHLIAKLIIKNTQPGLVNICSINLLHTNSFPAARLEVSNIGYGIVLKELQMADWHNWDLNYPSTGNTIDVDRCEKSSFSTTPSDMFRHLYFYDRADPGQYTYPFSRLIYLNSNTSKIQFIQITAK